MKKTIHSFPKYIFLTLVTCLFAAGAFAQSFTVTPSTFATAQIPEGGFEEMQIDLTNVSGSPLIFEWTTESNSMDTNWTTVLCDYQGCFPYIPQSGTMLELPDGQTAYIKLTIGVGSSLGQGVAVFRVWPQGNTAEAVDLTFTVDGVTSRQEDQIGKTIELYPNPVTDLLTVRNHGAESGMLRIMDMTGRMVKEQNINAQSVETVDLSTFTGGLYWVRLELGDKSASRRILKL